ARSSRRSAPASRPDRGSPAADCWSRGRRWPAAPPPWRGGLPARATRAERSPPARIQPYHGVADYSRGYAHMGATMRFLVVDDSSTMRRIIINTLHKLGYTECQEATNGREGMDRLAAAPVDFIITDWNMPEMSGVDFIRHVRANAETRHVPVVMVTTNA